MKKTIAYILISLLTILSVYGLGSVVLRTPASSATISSTSQLVNITFANTDGNTIYCQLRATSSSTANSTGYDLFNYSNSTSGVSTQVNTTFNFNGFEDSNDYTLTPYCQNSTTSITGTANTGITINFGTPTTPTSLLPSDDSIDTDGSITFSGTVTGANTTGCTLNVEGINYAMTHSANTCTYTLSGLQDSSYGWYMTATDGTDTSSATSLQSVKVEQKSGSSFAAIQAIKEKEQQSNTALQKVSKSLGTDELKSKFQQELTKPELIKTGIVAVIGAIVLGIIFPVVGIVPGAVIGGIIGMLL